ncbi:MAG: type II toxin-antitoxin system Phd/YefM family antitoxin [Kineosporiaceae bacterium]
MTVATSRPEVGVRELKNSLSRYLDRVRQGEQVVVTDRGRPVAVLSGLSPVEDHLVQLIERGLVRPPVSSARVTPRPIDVGATVSDLVADERR